MYIYETADEIEYELLKANAIKNRQYETQAENLLWLYLKGKQSGYKFRRQHVIKQYIADFINLKYKLIVEIDGKYHFRDEQIIKDEERTRDLEQWGYRVIRFTNEEIFNHREEVIKKIKKTIMAIESYNTDQIGGGQLNTQTNSQTSTQSGVQPQQTGASPLSGGLRGAVVNPPHIATTLYSLYQWRFVVLLGLSMLLALATQDQWNINVLTYRLVLRCSISDQFRGRIILENSLLLSML